MKFGTHSIWDPIYKYMHTYMHVCQNPLKTSWSWMLFGSHTIFVLYWLLHFLGYLTLILKIMFNATLSLWNGQKATTVEASLTLWQILHYPSSFFTLQSRQVFSTRARPSYRFTWSPAFTFRFLCPPLASFFISYNLKPLESAFKGFGRLLLSLSLSLSIYLIHGLVTFYKAFTIPTWDAKQGVWFVQARVSIKP